MKEDVLEQVVDSYLNLKGYFTCSNVKYRPSRDDPEYDSTKDSGYSDIDVIGIRPDQRGELHVIAVSCKSWQSGFNVARELDHLRAGRVVSGSPRWKAFRELANDKWARAFKSTVRELSGRDSFTHVIACAKCIDPENLELWTRNEEFRRRLTPALEVWQLEEMFRGSAEAIGTTLASSAMGRLIQVLRTAGVV